jgi:biotin carboxylase
MIKKNMDPISVKWYNDAVTNSQKCQHRVTHEKTGFDNTTVNVVHSANIVEEIGYPIMIKASAGDTVLDAKNVSP